MSLRSIHFSYDDFRCRSGAIYPPEWEDERLQPLCDTLDAIRDKWNAPIVVVCGYRDPVYNEALYEASAKRNGGKSQVAKDSQHIHGRAADIKPLQSTPIKVHQLYGTIMNMYQQGRLPLLGGIGLYANWIHVDVREKVNGKLAIWG